ncbi:MAG: YvcK family protein, partial [Gammaproteobacteria bacterium]|nr:YvcK family protein [Gammaproteobacteria bacterium]NIT52839.1 YvcK family protein [candidate division Zixibacteria bacterium]NIW45326.1 YvcK family protein [Gammaproteobacteria bacterium]
LSQFDVQNTRVVVLGGGTGLSNIIGGDSRKETWPEEPFNGLKEIFPHTKAIVCVTDDGGSTGELLKDLP